MGRAKYEVPLIPTENCRSVLVNKYVEALIQVEKVIDDMFSSINDRIKSVSEKVKELSYRAALAQLKVEKLSESTQQMQAFSSAEYPGHNVYEPYKQIFFEKENINFKFSDVCIKDDPRIMPDTEHYLSRGHLPEWDGTRAIVSNGGPKNFWKLVSMAQETSLTQHLCFNDDKFKFFHVRDSRCATQSSPNDTGLGDPPSYLTSISSLFLFNTTHNLYQKYTMIDALNNSAPPVIDSGFKQNDNTNVPLPAAPISIIEDQVRVPEDPLQYLPDLDDIPELDLPDELPDLLGIADDSFFYSGKEDESLFTPVQQVTEVSDLKKEDKNICLPSFEVSSPWIDVQEEDEPEKESFVPAPPPPPPPPLLSKQETTETSHVSTIREGVPSAVLVNSRANLMKAIQDAGGIGKAKLRQVSKKLEEETKATASPALSACDLMEDLRAKLSQRRKGISGISESSESKLCTRPTTDDSGLSTLEKISALIPPPQKTVHKTFESSQEDAYDDDDWS